MNIRKLAEKWLLRLLTIECKRNYATTSHECLIFFKAIWMSFCFNVESWMNSEPERANNSQSGRFFETNRRLRRSHWIFASMEKNQWIMLPIVPWIQHHVATASCLNLMACYSAQRFGLNNNLFYDSLKFYILEDMK